MGHQKHFKVLCQSKKRFLINLGGQIRAPRTPWNIIQCGSSSVIKVSCHHFQLSVSRFTVTKSFMSPKNHKTSPTSDVWFGHFKTI
jgi:hypothetical protein